VNVPAATTGAGKRAGASKNPAHDFPAWAVELVFSAFQISLPCL